MTLSRYSKIMCEVSDSEARYVLWSAAQADDGVFSKAADVVMRERLGIEPATQQNSAAEPQTEGTAQESGLSVDEVNEMVNNFKDDYGIKEDLADYHAIDSEEALEDFISNSTLNEDEADELREKFKDPGVKGTAYHETNDYVVIFTNKINTKKILVDVLFHETTHIAYKQIGFEEMKLFNNALIEWFGNTGNYKKGKEFLKMLFATHSQEKWPTELMAYFIGNEVSKKGWQKFISGKDSEYNEEIAKFVTRIINIISNGQLDRRSNRGSVGSLGRRREEDKRAAGAGENLDRGSDGRGVREDQEGGSDTVAEGGGGVLCNRTTRNDRY